MKADVLWEMGQINEAIELLESNNKDGSFSEKVVKIKKMCKEEYGLPNEHADIKKIERFMKWMREGGAKFKNVRMRYYGPDYRGVHACGEIGANEVFLNVPKNLIITPQSGRLTEIGAKILASKVKVNWDYLVYITIFLMVEMHNPESAWKPYLDVYPRLANNFPMFYNEYEKSLLKGTPMVEHMASEISQIKEEYERMIAAVPEFKQFSLEEYMRNKVLVISRIFYVKMHNVTERIMVPLAGIPIHLSYRYV